MSLCACGLAELHGMEGYIDRTGRSHGPHACDTGSMTMLGVERERLERDVLESTMADYLASEDPYYPISENAKLSRVQRDACAALAAFRALQEKR